MFQPDKINNEFFKLFLSIKVFFSVFVCFSLILFFPPSLFSQVTFERAYGSFASEEGRTVHQTSDGGYIISGITNGYGVGAYDIYLVKTDSVGSVEWSKTFGGVNDEHTTGHLPDMQITNDGGYIIAGHTNTFKHPAFPNASTNVYVIKTNSIGNLQWSKGFGYTGYMECNAIKQTNDSNYIITGGKDSLLDLYVLKFNSSLTFFSGASMAWGRNEAGNDIVETIDRKYVAAGYREDIMMNPAKRGICVGKFDCSTLGPGSLLWNKTYYEPGNSTTKAEAVSIIIANDGKYILSGNYEKSPQVPNMFLMKTDTSGNMIWFRLYSPNHIVKSVRQTKDNGFIISGSDGVSTLSHVFMMKTDSLGNVQWSKSYGGQNNINNKGYSAEQTADGGYVLGGTYGNLNNDIYILKTDSLGNSNCINQNLIISSALHSPAVMMPTPYLYTSMLLQNLNSITISTQNNERQPCHCYNMITTAFQDTTICLGNSATLSASSIPFGSYAYIWNTGATTSSITVAPPGTSTYSVTVIDSNACFSSDNVLVTIHSANASVAGNNTICVGGSTSLAATGGISYSWSTGSTSSSINIAPSATTTYSVIVTDTIGCIATASVTVLVGLYSTSSIIGNDTICEGESLTLTAISSPPATGYVWNTGSTTSSVIINPVTTTSYSVITYSGQCKDTSNATVAVNPSPAANAGNDATIDYGSSIILTGSGGGSYSWNTGSNSTDVFVSPNTTTTYTLIITDANGCTDIATVTVFVNELKCPIYLPNAFSPNSDDENDFFMLYYNPLCMKSASIVIYDYWGQKVFESSDKDFRWDGTYNGEKFNTGVFVYYLNVSYWQYEDKVAVLKGNVSLVR